MYHPNRHLVPKVASMTSRLVIQDKQKEAAADVDDENLNERSSTFSAGKRRVGGRLSRNETFFPPFLQMALNVEYPFHLALSWKFSKQ